MVLAGSNLPGLQEYLLFRPTRDTDPLAIQWATFLRNWEAPYVTLPNPNARSTDSEDSDDDLPGAEDTDSQVSFDLSPDDCSDGGHSQGTTEEDPTDEEVP